MELVEQDCLEEVLEHCQVLELLEEHQVEELDLGGHQLVVMDQEEHQSVATDLEGHL